MVRVRDTAVAVAQDEKGKRKPRRSLGQEIAERKDWGKKNDDQRRDESKNHTA